MQRRLSASVFNLVIVTSILAGAFVNAIPAQAATSVGAFEIDGNIADNSGAGDPIDWSTPGLAAVTTTDATGATDNIFDPSAPGTEDAPGTCVTGGVSTAANDLTKAQIGWRSILVGSTLKRFLYFNGTRAGTGETHIDWELNRPGTAAAGCPDLRTRSDGDFLFSLDRLSSGTATVSWRSWNGGVWSTNLLPPGPPPTAVWDGVVGGTLGEVAIDVTGIPCGAFAWVSQKTRSGSAFNSALVDRGAAKPIAPFCPISSLTKVVRNVTQGTPLPTGTYASSVNANPSDVVELALTYTNNGTGVATNVVLNDKVLDKSKFVTCFGDCSTAVNAGPGSPIVFNLGSVNPGASVTRKFQLKLDKNYGMNLSNWRNAATFTNDQEGTKPCAGPCGTVIVSANPASELHFAVRNVTQSEPFGGLQSPNATTADPGDFIEYQITYHNHGNGPASDLSITVPTPGHATFVSCTAGCTTGLGTITWQIGSLPKHLINPGMSAVVTFKVKLDGTFDQATTVIPSIGTVTSEQEGGVNSNVVSVTVNASPLSVLDHAIRNETAGGSFDSCGAGTDPCTNATAIPGNVIEYRITYHNDGTSPGHNIVVTEPIPGLSTFLDCTGSCTSGGGSLSWNLGDQPAGALVTLTFRVQLDPIFALNHTVIPDQANATSDEESVDSNVVTVEVDALPVSGLTATGTNITTSGAPGTNIAGNPANTIEYSVTYTNTGNGPATNVTITMPVQPKETLVSGSCTPSCTEGSNVVWNVGDIPAGGSVTVTFRVVLDPAFPSGTTVITNSASSTSAQDSAVSNDVLVNVLAVPHLSLTKSTPSTSAGQGASVTYTLAYANPAPGGNATGVVITETIPPNTTFASCTGGCTTGGGNVTWSIGTVNAGSGGSLTLTVTVGLDVGCTIDNVASISSPDQDNGAQIASNAVSITGIPGPNPTNAHANGKVLAAEVNDTATADYRFIERTSSQTGVGVTTAYGELAHVNATPNLATIELLQDSSKSLVTGPTSPPVRAEQVSHATVVNLNVLNGVVTSSLVRAVAFATANGTHADVNAVAPASASPGNESIGSAFDNLRIDTDGTGPQPGVLLNNPAPGTVVQLSPLAFGAGSFVKLREEIASVSVPSATQTSGGTYSGDISVTMIRVHITDRDPTTLGNQTLDVIVSQAVAHADFPQTTLCLNPVRRVSGNAAILIENTNPAILPVTVGYVGIPATGGSSTQQLQNISDPASGPTAGNTFSAQVSQTSSAGTQTPNNSSSFAQVSNLCVMRVSNVCTIQATTVKSVATSTASGGSATSSSNGTQLLGLTVNSTTFSQTPAANTTIPISIGGVVVGFVTLNEQICDNGVPLGGQPPTPQCVGTSASGLTVRAIHVYITATVPGGPAVGTEIIVAEAHSDVLSA